MHYITAVEYNSEYKLCLQFESGEWREADLKEHLDGKIFEPLKDATRFATAELNEDIDTVVWDNGADMSPDFLFEISVPVETPPMMKAAEAGAGYECRNENDE
ncbi:MAG: DUF2442 domain-containing protein [Kiritimatiellaeota bacterium]|nr:DUF2442 domain-containing protein [Kiritimatiellota bacterium]